MNNQSFITHIAGLRGLAILFVILFHFSLGNEKIADWFGNGYLGVDIFMVIMGYFLIRGYAEPKPGMSFFSFFSGKLKRLLVPMCICILGCSILGLLLIDYEHICLFSRTGAAACFGIANFELIDSARDYFALSSAMNMFLHTWYVSTALQLFLFSYIVFFCLRKARRLVIIAILLLLAALSFAVQFIIDGATLEKMGFSADAVELISSYYSPIPRIWEVLVGGAILLIPAIRNRYLAAGLSTVGLLMILFSAFAPVMGISTQTLPVILTVLGTLLVISYTQNDGAAHILNSRLLTWLGGISFSLYLVHMPIVVLYKGVTLTSPGMGCILALLLVSVLIGWIFCNYVEKVKIPNLSALLTCGAAFAICVLLKETKGLRDYWNKEVNAITYSRYDHFRYRYDKALQEHYDSRTMITFGQGGSGIVKKLCSSSCTISKSSDSPFLQLGCDKLAPSFVLMGDSHSIMSYPGIDTICKEAGLSGVMMNTLCLPFWERAYGSSKRSYSISKGKTHSFLNWLGKHKEIKHVVIIFSWYWMTDMLEVDWKNRKQGVVLEKNLICLERFLRELKGIDKQPIVFLPYPRYNTNNMLMYARLRARFALTSSPYHQDFVLSRADYNKRWGTAISAVRKFADEGICHIVDITPYLFENDMCHSIKDGDVRYFDCNHTSAGYSVNLAQKYKHILLQHLTSSLAAD